MSAYPPLPPVTPTVSETIIADAPLLRVPPPWEALLGLGALGALAVAVVVFATTGRGGRYSR